MQRVSTGVVARKVAVVATASLALAGAVYWSYELAAARHGWQSSVHRWHFAVLWGPAATAAVLVLVLAGAASRSTKPGLAELRRLARRDLPSSWATISHVRVLEGQPPGSAAMTPLAG